MDKRNYIVIYRDVIDEKTENPGDAVLTLFCEDDDVYDLDFPTEEELLEGDFYLDDLDSANVISFSEASLIFLSKEIEGMSPCVDTYQLTLTRITRTGFLAAFSGSGLTEKEMLPVDIQLPGRKEYIDRTMVNEKLSKEKGKKLEELEGKDGRKK